MTGADLIHLAGHLAVNTALGSSDEARHRSAASRAYYGAFHVARQFLFERLNLRTLQNQYGHQQVLDRLRQLSDPETDNAARLLHELRWCRNIADYDLGSSMFRNQGKARTCVEMAEAIRVALERQSP